MCTVLYGTVQHSKYGKKRQSCIRIGKEDLASCRDSFRIFSSPGRYSRVEERTKSFVDAWRIHH